MNSNKSRKYYLNVQRNMLIAAAGFFIPLVLLRYTINIPGTLKFSISAMLVSFGIFCFYVIKVYLLDVSTWKKAGHRLSALLYFLFLPIIFVVKGKTLKIRLVGILLGILEVVSFYLYNLIKP